ncbi:hypothetical protein SAMN06295912_101309 [Sphingomonas laterariae]|uniref:DUF1570 domain-containing protein n=1 Tax=Edaphosphingomonas laterariae TaxID=861865 RepID=A0A239BPA8_9SPHN|nr:hypothetical protein [Sphingomonas laterariae]SNS09509.1 hypothetical protein SAMN06295912_101309 [Sphingomonas laterariae]
MRKSKIIVAAFAMLIGNAELAQAAWVKAETPNFRIYSEGKPEQLKEYALLLEEYDQLLRMMTNTTAPPSPNKLDIYLVGNNSELRAVRPVSQNVGGFYSATAGAIAAFAIRRNMGGIDGLEVLQHEYAHHFMMQYYPGAYPGWYVEGFAEFMMTANITDEFTEVGNFNRDRALWLSNSAWVPTEYILEGDPGKLDGVGTSMFYSQSWLMVHWAFSKEMRGKALRGYLAARAKGETGVEVLTREMGMDYRMFHRALKAYADGRIGFLRFARQSKQAPIEVAMTPLSPAADDILLTAAGLSLGVDEKRGPAVLARIRDGAKRHAGDPMAITALAEAEIDFGDHAAGTAMLDKLIADGAKDARTLFLRGYADLTKARRLEGEARAPHYAAARKWFARTFRVDQNYVPALWGYVECFGDKPLDDNTLNVLLHAQALAPQVDSLRMNAAVAFLRRKEFDRATRMITPLAADPHGGKMAKLAGHLLDKAKARSFSEADLKTGEEDVGVAAKGRGDGKS